eukprot:TRINITY_DN124578_c0_g1_i1.p3 TRINITY_DN124578_c0_g1~~TRINITY_DN124578_c0_g1_i1.p3  ORF type:complete len:105 (-),score=8.46 TRINITY_DN124578_c0_g1_i1:102-416(-)
MAQKGADDHAKILASNAARVTAFCAGLDEWKAFVDTVDSDGCDGNIKQQKRLLLTLSAPAELKSVGSAGRIRWAAPAQDTCSLRSFFSDDLLALCLRLCFDTLP